MIRFALLASFSCYALLAGVVGTALAADPVSLDFEFGSSVTKPGTVRVLPAAAYSAASGYGFENSPVLTTSAQGVSSDRPFSFSIKLPEGNYNVTAALGDGQSASMNTVKVEARRLMLEGVPVAAGKLETRTFTVNIRTPHIKTGGEVKLNPRESGPPIALRWDGKLTLEFNGTHPAVSELKITRNDTAPTIFLAGDSTVTEQGNEPWAGWGQMLSRFLVPGIAVSNHAESGLTLRSFKAQLRLAKILGDLRKGDYVFIQFGHNDQKEKGDGVGPFTTYKQSLKDYVADVRRAGGTPVLVTSMERRHWEGSTLKPTLADYAEAVRQVGHEDNVPVIDLNAMSLKFYEALGPEGSTKAFVHYPAGMYPGQDKPLNDDTHHNNYGAYELARCVVEGIRTQVPALAAFLAKDIPAFDPAHPDSAAAFGVPPSLSVTVEKPAGG